MMTSIEQARLTPLYENMLRALKLQGMAKSTVDAYSRAVRRTADFFDRCPDDLTAEELKTYFASLLETHSWSTIKLDRCGLQFFYYHVLDKQWTWVDIVKPPKEQRLPDILTRDETHRLLGSFHKLRYRVYFLLIYSTGLRLNEGLRLEVGDIDKDRLRIHVRGGKGRKDRYVPITDVLLKMLRQWWKEHRNPKLIFPNPVGGPERMSTTTRPMHVGGVQAAMRATVADCGIKLHITAHSLRHCFGTHMLELGVDLRELQTILGHSKPETTARYTHITDVTSHQARERQGELLASFLLRWKDQE
ncbi:MAG: site-specific integrase [Sedimenticola sp.]